jgi:hypothetical protein
MKQRTAMKRGARILTPRPQRSLRQIDRIEHSYRRGGRRERGVKFFASLDEQISAPMSATATNLNRPLEPTRGAGLLTRYMLRGQLTPRRWIASALTHRRM